MRPNTQGEERIDQGEEAANPRPTVTAAAPAPPPATAAVVPPPPPLLPQHPPAVHLDLLLHGGRGGVVAPLHARLAAAAAATAPTGIAAKRSGIGGGAAQKDRAATRKTAAIPGSTGAAGADPGLERGTGAEPRPETAAVAAETEKRREKGTERGRGVEIAGTAVTAVAANTNKSPPAKTERGGGREVIATRRTKRKRIKTRTGRKTQIKRRTKQSPKRKKRTKTDEVLLRRRMVNQRKGKRVTPAQTPRVTGTHGRRVNRARRAPPKLARDARTLIQVGPRPLKLARKRNLRNPNVVAHGRRRSLTSLVRRQAANTSLSRDQGSIHFFLLLSYCMF